MEDAKDKDHAPPTYDDSENKKSAGEEVAVEASAAAAAISAPAAQLLSERSEKKDYGRNGGPRNEMTTLTPALGGSDARPVAAAAAAAPKSVPKPAAGDDPSSPAIAAPAPAPDGSSDPPKPGSSAKVAATPPPPVLCLLCKRRFPDEAALRRHEQKSELHRTNLASRERKEARRKARREEARRRQERRQSEEEEQQRRENEPILKKEGACSNSAASAGNDAAAAVGRARDVVAAVPDHVVSGAAAAEVEVAVASASSKTLPPPGQSSGEAPPARPTTMPAAAVAPDFGAAAAAGMAPERAVSSSSACAAAAGVAVSAEPEPAADDSEPSFADAAAEPIENAEAITSHGRGGSSSHERQPSRGGGLERSAKRSARSVSADGRSDRGDNAASASDDDGGLIPAWKCGRCLSRYFDTFDEAIEHRTNCRDGEGGSGSAGGGEKDLEGRASAEVKEDASPDNDDLSERRRSRGGQRGKKGVEKGKKREKKRRECEVVSETEEGVPAAAAAASVKGPRVEDPEDASGEVKVRRHTLDRRRRKKKRKRAREEPEEEEGEAEREAEAEEGDTATEGDTVGSGETENDNEDLDYHDPSSDNFVIAAGPDGTEGYEFSLALPREDEHNLSDLHRFVRERCVEGFVVTQADLDEGRVVVDRHHHGHVHGRRVDAGTVGIRCVFCGGGSHNTAGEGEGDDSEDEERTRAISDDRPASAAAAANSDEADKIDKRTAAPHSHSHSVPVSYPPNTRRIFDIISRYGDGHIDACELAPLSVKAALRKLRAATNGKDGRKKIHHPPQQEYCHTAALRIGIVNTTGGLRLDRGGHERWLEELDTSETEEDDDEDEEEGEGDGGPTTTLPCIMGQPSDSETMSPLHRLARSSLELFLVETQDEADRYEQNIATSHNTATISPAQVGLRCVHCHAAGEAPRKSNTKFPTTVEDLYHVVRKFFYGHFDDRCPSASDELAEEFRAARTVKTKYLHVSESYRSHALDMGLYNLPDCGIGFRNGEDAEGVDDDDDDASDGEDDSGQSSSSEEEELSDSFDEHSAESAADDDDDDDDEEEEEEESASSEEESEGNEDQHAEEDVSRDPSTVRTLSSLIRPAERNMTAPFKLALYDHIRVLKFHPDSPYTISRNKKDLYHDRTGVGCAHCHKAPSYPSSGESWQRNSLWRLQTHLLEECGQIGASERAKLRRLASRSKKNHMKGSLKRTHKQLHTLLWGRIKRLEKVDGLGDLDDHSGGGEEEEEEDGCSSDSFGDSEDSSSRP